MNKKAKIIASAQDLKLWGIPSKLKGRKCRVLETTKNGCTVKVRYGLFKVQLLMPERFLEFIK